MGASIREKTTLISFILRTSTRADGKLGNVSNGVTMNGNTKTGGAEMKVN